ncbi:uncharacterized protein [Palaemon carinicauda]|uniref:uncharacterized protein n=1 Tax=Palaemon carinicauda TaxID=392227 RepID=UPI0035B6531D
MRRKTRPTKQKAGKNPGRRGRQPKRKRESSPTKAKVSKKAAVALEAAAAAGVPVRKSGGASLSTIIVVDDGISEGLHMTTSQVNALSHLVACRECGEAVNVGVRPTTKGMISEFTVTCSVCDDHKSTNTPNLVRERKRKREKKDCMLQKTENINYAHVAAFLDNGLGYSGLRHYCKYFNARCLNEATFIVYARQVIIDVINDTEESLLYAASIVREVFKSQLETDGLVDLTVAYTTTYHQWGSDFCLVAGAVIELTTGLVLDYDVANMYCHVCKINAKKIVSMSPAEMTEWFNNHQDSCEIREWCDELDHDAEEGVREIEPKYLECFVAKKIWMRSIEKYGFRYTTLIHESDEKIHEELSKAAIYDDIPILIDANSSCFSRRKSEHARTSFQTKLKAKCPRERVQTKDRILYVYAMSIPEYNKFAVSSNIKLRQLVKAMEGMDDTGLLFDQGEGQEGEENRIQIIEANGEEHEPQEGEVIYAEVRGEEVIPIKKGEPSQEKEEEEEEAEMEEQEEAEMEEQEEAEMEEQEEVLQEEPHEEEEEEEEEEEGRGEGEKTIEQDADTADSEEMEESTEAVVKYLKETDPSLKVKEEVKPET